MSDTNGRVLLVEDDPIARKLVSRRLEEMGYDVAEAENGRAALERLADSLYDVVLLDLMMPGMDGWETLRRLRTQWSSVELPILMLTAVDEVDEIVRALEEGANDYLLKPVDFRVLKARLEAHLSIKRLARVKDEFLAIASHDLKNPLQTILGYASLIPQLNPEGEPMKADTLAFAERICNRAKVMQRIIEDFLDFRALEEGQVQIESAPVDLNALVAEAVEAQRDYAESKDIALSFVPDGDAPTVEGDMARLEQVVANLVGNAIKFSPAESKVEVRSAVRDGRARIEVRDGGPGLTPEDFKKLFTKYARLSNKPTGGEKSSGLGLAICKELIQRQGGEIGARNNDDAPGATFWFHMPHVDAATPATARESAGASILA